MTVKKNQNALRQQLLDNGNVKPNLQPSAFRHYDPKESMAAAIAARRQDIAIVPTVSKEKK